jgi:dTDP-4-amino-4,6-dideoxygalactose transaminase
MSLNFIDLAAQQARIKPQIETAIAAVLDHGRYILGPEVQDFETQLAAFGDATHALGCANGTDALLLPLMSWRIPRGAAVFCPSFTYCATVEVVALMGAVPVYVDIDRDTYNICPDSLRQAIEGVKAEGELEPWGVITVDLFGQSADYERLAPIVREHGLKLIADSAQGFGTTLNGKQPLHFSDVATTSFFPAKPLGCYGDGGAVLTNDTELLNIMKSVHMHGSGTDKYDNVRVGLNSRLDSIQAAILIEKLAIFADEIDARNTIATRYCDGLKSYVLRVPTVLDGVISTWAQFTIEVDDPDGLSATLREANIPTARYYPKPVHEQTAYAHHPRGKGGMAHTEDAMTKVIALPMHPYLSETDQDFIIEHIKAALK